MDSLVTQCLFCSVVVDDLTDDDMKTRRAGQVSNSTATQSRGYFGHNFPMATLREFLRLNKDKTLTSGEKELLGKESILWWDEGFQVASGPVLPMMAVVVVVVRGCMWHKQKEC